LLFAASNQENRRSLLAEKKEFREKKGKKNNQAAQAIDQSKFFGGGINQGQAGEDSSLGRPNRRFKDRKYARSVIFS
jgi:hypothetical protein